MIISAKNERDKSVTIDGTEHKVIYPAVRFFDSISAGDEVEVKFDEKPEQNIVFIRKFDVGREGDIVSGQHDEYNRMPPTEKEWKNKEDERWNDPMRPLGNLYAMCEENFHAIIEQNTIILTQNVNNNELLFKIAEKIKLDLGLPKTKKEDNVLQ